LRYPLHKPLQAPKYLGHILRIQHITLRFPNQGLHFEKTIRIQVVPETLIDLLQHFGEKFLLLVFPSLKHLIHETNLQHILSRDPLAHNQRLVRFTDTKPLNESPTGASFGDKTKRCEWCEEKGVGRCVDEVAEGDERGGKTDCGAIESGDEDLGVRVEGIGYVEVAGYEVFDRFAAELGWCKLGSGSCDIGASEK